MRSTRLNQEWLRPSRVREERSVDPLVKEVERLSALLDRLPDIGAIYDLVTRDLVGDLECDTGRKGLTGEQVLRAALIHRKFEFCYRTLALFLNETLLLREFVRLEPTRSVSKSALQRDITQISEETWQSLEASIKRFAEKKGIEAGEVVRSDTTVSETNIHHPTDSSLLYDCIRVLTRILQRTKAAHPGVCFQYSNHIRRAKKRLYKINIAKKDVHRRRAYEDLIKICHWVRNYASNAAKKLDEHVFASGREAATAQQFMQEIQHYLPLCEQVLSQTIRRVLYEEKVPAEEKVFSIFETHTDIIRKGGRDTQYGHKVCLTSGKSGLILDCDILSGNPRDCDLVSSLIERHKQFYKKAPTAMAFDGGFASKQAQEAALAAEVQEVVFGKPTGKTQIPLTTSDVIFKALSKFRAGIEGGISALKRAYGLRRVFAKGLEAFKTALRCGVCVFNLTLLARHKLAFQ